MTRLLRHTVHGTVEVRMDEFLNLLCVPGHGLEDVSCDFQECSELSLLRFIDCFKPR